MDQNSTPKLDADQFRRVWRRVMPEDRHDCPFTLDPPAPPSPLPPPAVQPPAACPLPSPMGLPAHPAGGFSACSTGCLGEDSAGDLAVLGRLLCLTEESRVAYQNLRGRGKRGSGPLMAELRTAKESQRRRLAAAYFLISGEGCDLPGPGPKMTWESFSLAVRACYHRERRAALQFFTAAERLRDPCLMDLCRAVGREDLAHAGRLRAWLEQNGQ